MPYRKKPQRPSSVPFELAQRLVEERDALVREVERLNQQNASLLERIASEREEHTPDEDAIEALVRRVEELTRDLTRVQQRTAIEVTEARISERAQHLAGVAEVLDSVQRGLAMDFSGGPAAWRTGLQAIETQLLEFFRGQGATLTGQVGEPYDPQLHEAIAMVEGSGLGSGRITKVARPGVMLENGHVARAAQVLVAK